MNNPVDVKSICPCAVCGEPAITLRRISINSKPRKSLPVCEIHADAADEDTKPEKI